MPNDWVAIDRDRLGRSATFVAASLVEARAIAKRQLGIPSERLHCAAVADGESIAQAQERVRREAERGPQQGDRVQGVKLERARGDRGRFDST